METEKVNGWPDWVNYVYHDMWEVYARPEANDFPLMSGGPWTVLASAAIYLALSIYIGPWYMRGKKPLPLRTPIMVFDVLLIVYNFTLLVVGLGISNFGLDVWFTCNEAFDPKYGRIPYYVGYAYFLSKYLDLLDTMFFVLRKKRRNISFLHLYHHSVMLVIAWAGLKYVPFPLSGWALGANSFIHTLMYSYYAVAAAGYKMNIRFKQALTALQIGHFITISLHGAHILLFLTGPSCIYPPSMAICEILIGGSFFVLFAHFFVVNYVTPKPKPSDIQRPAV
ncbi:Elongation of very long chain fatty acids protein 7 [Halotydeus destructor]|nr:Elongation of very long chain fatty acids protein 7 [Halotydeus destructor]